MNFLKYSVAALLCFAVATSASADPLYSLDQMQLHPYRYVPAFGYAWQNPGSPKYFRPGYGYLIPGPGFNGLGVLPVSTSDIFEYGDSAETGFYRGKSYGTSPWFFPGQSPATIPRWPHF